MPASVAMLPPPHPPPHLVRPPVPIYIPIQFFNLAPGYRLTLIRGADRPCPHPDPSSLEHVNLPVTQTGMHTHMPQHTSDIEKGCSGHIHLRMGSDNPRTLKVHDKHERGKY